MSQNNSTMEFNCSKTQIRSTNSLLASLSGDDVLRASVEIEPMQPPHYFCSTPIRSTNSLLCSLTMNATFNNKSLENCCNVTPIRSTYSLLKSLHTDGMNQSLAQEEASMEYHYNVTPVQNTNSLLRSLQEMSRPDEHFDDEAVAINCNEDNIDKTKSLQDSSEGNTYVSCQNTLGLEVESHIDNSVSCDFEEYYYDVPEFYQEVEVSSEKNLTSSLIVEIDSFNHVTPCMTQDNINESSEFQNWTFSLPLSSQDSVCVTLPPDVLLSNYCCEYDIAYAKKDLKPYYCRNYQSQKVLQSMKSDFEKVIPPGQSLQQFYKAPEKSFKYLLKDLHRQINEILLFLENE